MNHLPRTSCRRYAIGVLSFFILSRIVYNLVSTFHFDRIHDLMQYLDVQLLRDDLLRSIWYLHDQPPLMNLSMGILLKLVPDSWEPAVMAALYMLMGAVIVLGVFWLLVRRGVRYRVAAAVAGAFCVTPSLLWAEHMPGYVYPATTLLIAATIALQRFADTRNTMWLLLALGGVACLPLNRSFFHLIFWLLPVLIGILLLVRRVAPALLRRAIVAAVVIACLVAGVYLKNYLMFGNFTGSTWQGMNFFGVVSMTDRTKIEQLIAKQEATPLALLPRFSSPGEYYRYYHIIPRMTIDVLDDTLRSSGAINWNNRIYAHASPEYQSNAIAIARNYPMEVIRGVLNQAYIFCGFLTYRLFNDPSRWWIPRNDTLIHMATDIAIVYLIPAVMLLLITATVVRYVREVRHGLRSPDRWTSTHGHLAASLFAGFCVVYIVLVSCLAELGEGATLRIQIEPYIAVTVGVLIERFLSRIEYGRGFALAIGKEAQG